MRVPFFLFISQTYEGHSINRHKCFNFETFICNLYHLFTSINWQSKMSSDYRFYYFMSIWTQNFQFIMASPVLAEIFLDYTQETIHNRTLSHKFVFWYVSRWHFTLYHRYIFTYLICSKAIYPNILELISNIQYKDEFAIFGKSFKTDITINKSTSPLST